MLVRLLYASHATQSIDDKFLEEILSASKKHNSDAGITGILCYTGKTFVQVLEGGRSEVSRLYNRIVADNRHKGCEILLFENITERRFSNWTMGQVNLSKVNPSTLLRYSTKPELDPFAVSGQISLALLEELINTAAIATRN